MTPPDRLITRTLGDGLIVARTGGHRLFVMNASARFIWEQRVHGTDDTKIPSLMAEHYGIDIAQAQLDCRQTLARWRADGLTDPTGPCRFYSIGDISFSIEYPNSDIEAIVKPIFDHLKSAAPRFPDDGYEREFSIGIENDHFVLRIDGLEVMMSVALDPVIEKLVLEVVMHAYGRLDWLISIHAAAVGTDRACILLPGASGAGKSTLTASLLGRSQLRYLTDDIVLLDRDSLHAIPVPGTLVLKSGSWGPLASMLPDLQERAVHRRNDEDVKYWAPPFERIAATPLRVKAVVFPRRDDQTKPVLTPVAPLEGLSQIIAAPITLSPPITSETVDRLMQWARRTPFYTVTFGRLEDAAAMLATLLDQ